MHQTEVDDNASSFEATRKFIQQSRSGLKEELDNSLKQELSLPLKIEALGHA
jgi:hypothetical protein